MRRVITALVLIAAVTGLVALGTTRLAAATSTRIMSGLNNPRGLAIGPDGGIYVAEAGTGGAGPCLVNVQGETRCFGPSGSVSRFLNGVQQRVFTQFSSHALPNGSQALGPADVGFLGTTMFVTIGLGMNPSERPGFGPGGAMFGKLLQVSTTGALTEAADVSAYERDVNPAGGPIDTNPFGLLVQPDQRVVADAGANALLSIAPSGLVNTIATFPSRPDRAT